MINGLFATGLDSAGQVIGNYGVDAHYTVWNGSAWAPTTTGPLYTSWWIANDSNSLWIWENANWQPSNVNRTFRTTVDLAGFDLDTVVLNGIWAVDNAGTDILINGVSTGQRTTDSFSSWSSFSITDNFVDGINTIDFVASDWGAAAAFRVGALSGTGDRLPEPSVPEPTSMLLLLTSAGAVLGVARRRRRGRH